MIKWRGIVASAIRGRRGQAFLRDLLAALDTMPNRRLIADELVSKGEVCAIGALGVARGIDMSEYEPDDPDSLAGVFDVAHQLVREVTYLNDEAYCYATPERRFELMRAWVAEQVRGV